MKKNGYLTQNGLRKMVILSMLVAVGFVLSPILRVPGMAPMQHFINVVCAVLLGPWYAVLCAVMISLLRMALLGVNMLALPGSFFGALLSGYFYMKVQKLPAAVIGEIIGTGIIGAIVAYPIMTYVYGNADLALFFYVPSFVAGATIGSLFAFVFLQTLKKQGVLARLQSSLRKDV